MLGSQAPVIREINVEPPLLIDVTPLTLAVETVGGYCDTVIERNSPIPCEKTRQFATVQDGQESVRVRVSQGEASIFSDNTLLGELVLTGLRRGPRGSVRIDVNFALDTSGMLNVNASDVDTGRSVSTRIRMVGLADAAPLEQMQRRHAAHYVS
jgi:molecular chaperone DnaK